MFTVKQRKTRNEFVMILVKAIIFTVLVYFRVNTPEVYDKYLFVNQLARALFIFIGPSLTASILRLIIIFVYIKKHQTEVQY